MAVHTPHLQSREPVRGGALLPIFTVALLVAILPIVLVGVHPTVVTLVAALGTIIAFAIGLIALVGRMIGPDQH